MNSPNNSSKPTHSGHRARMRERFFETKGAGFEAHELLELLLFAAIPKRDVNPLAHELLNHFGSLSNVLSASKEELMTVPGIGPSAGELIRTMGELSRYFGENWARSNRTFQTLTDVLYHIRTKFPPTQMHELICMFESANGSLMTTRLLPGRIADPQILRTIISEALRLHTHSIVLAYRSFTPLSDLRESNLKEIEQLISMLNDVNIYTIDYLLLSGNSVFSLRYADLLEDSRNSLHENLPRWYAWFEPLLLFPSANNWHEISTPQLKQLLNASDRQFDK